MQWKPVEMRTKGSPKNRWAHEVLNDLKKLKVENCMYLVKEREGLV